MAAIRVTAFDMSAGQLYLPAGNAGKGFRARLRRVDTAQHLDQSKRLEKSQCFANAQPLLSGQNMI